MAPLVKPAVVAAVVGALGLGVAVSPRPRDSVAKPASVLARPRLDAASDAQARRMRSVLMLLAARTAAGARCHPADRPARYAPCVLPALQHAGIGGTTAMNVLNIVIAGVPTGPCRDYLFGLQAAAQATGEQARWLLPNMYGPDRQQAQREVDKQLGQMTRMLRRAARAAPADVCSVGASVTASGPPA
jgi:hypothetical protein